MLPSSNSRMEIRGRGSLSLSRSKSKPFSSSRKSFSRLSFCYTFASGFTYFYQAKGSSKSSRGSILLIVKSESKFVSQFLGKMSA